MFLFHPQIQHFLPLLSCALPAFDDVVKNLKLWQDRNGDGRTDEGELLSLSDVGLLLEACMKLGHSERERKGVFGLGGLWRIVWCMEIGAIGVVKV